MAMRKINYVINTASFTQDWPLKLSNKIAVLYYTIIVTSNKEY